ncbi:MAG: type II secretion system protein [Candidatus Gastranaerophilaceae bacterium]|nr:type II secretion system protein [Candidatus Gastranaerophilaceae bacterium]
MIGFKHGGGAKSSHSKGSSDLGSSAAKKLSSLEGTAFPSINGRGLKINLSKAKVRFSGEGSDLSDRVKSLVSTAEKTAGLPRSQGYLLPRNDMGKRAAFTLAEVLITLGIIGVVAAMTLPALMQNYQKQQFLSSLKKNYTVLAQGVKIAQANHGEDLMSWNCNDCPFPGYYNSQFTINVMKLFEYLGEGVKYAEIVDKHGQQGLTPVTFCGVPESEGYKMMNGSAMDTGSFGGLWSSGYAVLQDGSCWYLGETKRSNTSDVMASVVIDVNGNKRPNQMGKDVYVFDIHRNGAVMPPDGDTRNCSHLSWAGGRNCSALIMNNGWSFPKDYYWK